MVSRVQWLGLLVAAVVGSAGCGTSDDPVSKLWSNTVVVTSENSSEFMLGLAEVSCRADGDRLVVTSGEVTREGGTVDSAVLEVSVDPNQVEVGRDYPLGSGAGGEGAFEVSVLVPAATASPPAPQRANRATSTMDGSRGTLRFESLACGDRPGASLTIDAVLASVYDDRGVVPVEGELWVTHSGAGQ